MRLLWIFVVVSANASLDLEILPFNLTQFVFFSSHHLSADVYHMCLSKLILLNSLECCIISFKVQAHNKCYVSYNHNLKFNGEGFFFKLIGYFHLGV